jgi:hypothetical protein
MLTNEGLRIAVRSTFTASRSLPFQDVHSAGNNNWSRMFTLQGTTSGCLGFATYRWRVLAQKSELRSVYSGVPNRGIYQACQRVRRSPGKTLSGLSRNVLLQPRSLGRPSKASVWRHLFFSCHAVLFAIAQVHPLSQHLLLWRARVAHVYRMATCCDLSPFPHLLLWRPVDVRSSTMTRPRLLLPSSCIAVPRKSSFYLVRKHSMSGCDCRRCFG